MVDEPKNLSRRNFLGVLGGVSAGVMGTTLLPSELVAEENEAALQNFRALPGYQPKVASAWVERGEKPYNLFKKVVESSTDFSWLKPGDSVFLKLALNSPNKFPATTDPWSIECMIKLLREKGAGEIIVGDQSGVEHVCHGEKGSRGSTRDLCKRSGLFDVIVKNGATPSFFEELGYGEYRETFLPTGNHWGKSIFVTKAIDNVDHIVYMARVGSHVLGDITSGLKLAVGFLRDDSRGVFHQGGKNFYEMYEEINTAPQIASKLRLSVSSATEVLSTLGPDLGYVSKPDHGLVFASEDLLAHELLAYAWLIWNHDLNTPELHRVKGQIVESGRALLNKGLMIFFDKGFKDLKFFTPKIPFFQPGIIYNHPSIKNFMQRKGGRPEKLIWQQINKNPKEDIAAFMKKQMLISD